ncbi:unnamed protein product [Lactuca saligna]|uniref:Uncharacterized protein n=1 Tax=Lactuca saligna TaxID=75948 RepID=A0AA35ULC3_LACSI|nr:unnamed protein product [Lactuca saligna]
MERIHRETIDDQNIHWIEPLVSFEQSNMENSQLDFPIIPKAFLFRFFEKIENAPLSDYDVNHMLFSFYLKYAKPQFKAWNLQKIVALKVYARIPTEDFINIRFKGFPGASRTKDEFNLVDSPCMIPYDWITLFLIVSKDEKTYEPIVSHLKRMLICYIHEPAKMDVEIGYILKKRPILKHQEELEDLHKLKLGKIRKEN